MSNTRRAHNATKTIRTSQVPADFATSIGGAKVARTSIRLARKVRHSNIHDADRSDMLALYVGGMPVKTIAYKLCVAPGTVYRHLAMARRAGFLKVTHKRGRKGCWEDATGVNMVVAA